MNQLTKRIQENWHVNSFDALKEETLDETILVAAPAPKLLDKQKLEELMAAYKAKQSPARTPSPLKTKMVQEFIRDNAHKFDKATCKQLADLCKPKSKPSAQQMGDALKNQIPYIDEDTKIRMLNALVPAIRFDIQKIETLAKTFGIDTAFVNRSNSVQIPITLVSYKWESTVTTLLNTRATENFIDTEAVTWLHLGTKDLPYKHIAYNVDGTVNVHGCITKYCDLLISKGNTKWQQWFYVTNLGKDHFLLGYPWFKAFKPDIDWEYRTLKGPKVKAETTQKVTWDKARSYLKDKQQKDQDSDFIYEANELDTERLENPDQILQELKEESLPNIYIGRTTMEINQTHNATEMAHKYTEQHKKEEIILPAEFQWCALLFSNKEAKKFPPSRSCDHKIELTADALDKFNCKTYPMSLKDQEAENKFLDKNLEKGYIIPSESPYGFSTFMVPKKDSNEKCYIINYHPLNAVTHKDVTPLPILAQCIEDLQGMELFSKFDVYWGYNNIHIHKGDEWKAAFKTCHGLFEPKVMFFGMSNLPLTFQRFMNLMLEKLYQHFEKKGIYNIWKMFKSYMDNCGLETLAKDKQLHIEILHYAFNLLAKNRLHLKLSKSIFMQPTMDFLGVCINKNSATIDPAKITGIMEWPEDIKTLKEAHTFVGMLGYHCMFIPGFSSITAPITCLFSKSIPFE